MCIHTQILPAIQVFKRLTRTEKYADPKRKPCGTTDYTIFCRNAISMKKAAIDLENKVFGVKEKKKKKTTED